MLSAPCKDCQDRFPECHVSCERYKSFKQDLNEFKEKVTKQRDLECGLADIKRAGIRRMMGKKHV